MVMLYTEVTRVKDVRPDILKLARCVRHFFREKCFHIHLILKLCGQKGKIMNLENSINNPYAQQLPSGGASQSPKPLVQFSGGTYPPMINPNLQPMPLPPHLMEKVYLAELEVAKANAKKSHEYLLKSDLEFQKNFYAEKREQTRERHRRERELVQTRVFENSDGYFCIEQKYPDGSSKISQPVLPISKVRLKKSVSQMLPENNCFIIYWREDTTGIKIPESDMTVEKLAKIFQQKGFFLSVSRTKKVETWESILAFLFEESEEIESLAFFGWNKVKSGWIFNKE